MSLTVLFFIVLGTLAIASGILTVISKNPVASALSLVFHFFTLAGLYLTLNAQFIAVVQILVYAGAIMVLVVFVIMLLNLGDEELLKEKLNYRKLLAGLFASVMVIMLLTIFLSQPMTMEFLPENAAEIGSAESIGAVLFTEYLFPFEAVSLLLLAAIIGSVLLAKRKIQ